jgi:hypothetical protein
MDSMRTLMQRISSCSMRCPMSMPHAAAGTTNSPHTTTQGEHQHDSAAGGIGGGMDSSGSAGQSLL